MQTLSNPDLLDAIERLERIISTPIAAGGYRDPSLGMCLSSLTAELSRRASSSITAMPGSAGMAGIPAMVTK